MRTHSLSDIRAIIAMVLGLIGLFLILCGAVANGPAEMAKTGDINANLWAGVALLVIGGGMGLWWWLKPLTQGEVLTEEVAAEEVL